MTAFHDAVARALAGDRKALEPWLAADQADAFAVYRNTSIKARIDALRDNYPVVAQLVGEEWFRAAAASHVEAHPGSDPVMAAYGAEFPRWLADFGPARDLAYLAPMARLDRAWTEAHLAPEARPLTASQAAAHGSAGLAGRVLALHPSARVFWFDWTAPSLWLSHRYPDSAELVWAPDPEGLLIHRPGEVVRATRLSRAAWVFLDACRSGRPAGVAAQAAAAADPACNIAELFTGLVEAEAFTADPKTRTLA